jgi:hypothetical protein
MPEEIGSVVVAIVGPYPSPSSIREGWMSRIAAIDREFVGLRRIYLNFAEHHDDDAAEVVWRDQSTAEVLLDPLGRKSANLMARICAEVNLLYVHTLHLAEHILPWMHIGKVCVDIHGVTPEEEVMMRRPELKLRYERVEERVFAEAMTCVAVSNAMIEHYAEKYPQLKPNWIMIPVIEDIWEDEASRSGRFAMQAPHQEIPVAVIYAGGTQPWQNVAGMLELAKNTKPWSKFAFYSHEQKLIRKSAKKIGVAIRAGFCDKDRLPAVYGAADFGLVLRDDTAVNRVACPTKLTEYLRFGVVPIVRSPQLGDFYAKGYQFVLESDFKAGFFPDSASREWMMTRNFQVLRSMADDYFAGASILHDLASGPSESTYLELE